jgi:hypothetical protein
LETIVLGKKVWHVYQFEMEKLGLCAR